MNKYCNNCNQEVGVKAKVSWGMFAIWTLLTGPGVLAYIFYVLTIKEKNICCKCKSEI